jgi:hypothetical protein
LMTMSQLLCTTPIPKNLLAAIPIFLDPQFMLLSYLLHDLYRLWCL